MTLHALLSGPLGDLILTGRADPSARHGIVLTSLRMPATIIEPPASVRDDDAFRPVAAQLAEYLAGDRTRFEVDVDTPGTVSQAKVWQVLDAIPYGVTRTYGQVAVAAGLPPAAVRAVGRMIGANPLLVIRPCHRVIGASGALTGYAGGLERKRHLLTAEGVLTPVLG